MSISPRVIDALNQARSEVVRHGVVVRSPIDLEAPAGTLMHEMRADSIEQARQYVELVVAGRTLVALGFSAAGALQVAEAAAPLRICAARIVADAYWRISEAVGNFSEGSPAADFSEAARQA